jgi:Tfp pilus assembly protein PilF
LYIATTGYGLVGDDSILIGDNPYIRSFHFLRQIFTQNFWSFRGARGQSVYYRPMVMFSFLLQARLFGIRSAPFHLVNVLINAAVVAMVYQLGKRFWPVGRGAWWGALLFAALPVHTEDVATVSGISDLECAAFFLGAFLVYTGSAAAAAVGQDVAVSSEQSDMPVGQGAPKDHENDEPALSPLGERVDRDGAFISRRGTGEGVLRTPRPLFSEQGTAGAGFSRVRAWMSALLFLLAALSKETALAAPPLLIFYEHFLRRDRARPRERLSRYLPTLLLAGFYIVVHLAVIADYAAVESPRRMPRRDSLMFGFTQLGEYVAKLLWPQHMSYYWRFRPPSSVWEPTLLLGLLFALWSAGVVVAGWRRDRSVSFAIIWFFLTLAPVLSFAGIGVPGYGERYLYLPSVGICWLLGAGLDLMARKGGSALLLPLGEGPGVRGRTATSHPWFPWRKGAALGPPGQVVATALGLALVAAAALKTGLRLPVWRSNFTLGRATVQEDPNAAMFHVYLGNEYRQRGNRDGARTEYIQAIASDPLAGEAFVNLAGVLLDEGSVGAAEDVLRRGAQLNATFSKPLFALGKIAGRRGDKAEARDLYERALARDPNDGEVLVALGILSLEEERLAEAESLLGRAALVQPASALVHLNLGAVLARERKFANSEAEFRRAIELAPESEPPYLALAASFEDQGKQAAALDLYRQIVAAAPHSANAQFRLGVLALQMGKNGEAVAALEKAAVEQPQSTLVHAQLGMAYLASGNPERARQEIEKAEASAPDDATVRLAVTKLKAQTRPGSPRGKKGER